MLNSNGVPSSDKLAELTATATIDVDIEEECSRNSGIALYHTDAIKNIDWPNSADSLDAQKLPLKILEKGVPAYISNIKTDYMFLIIDNVVIPITVNYREYHNAYLASNYYNVHELKEKSSKWLHPFLNCYGLLLKCMKINRVVIINNWLLSGQHPLILTANQVKRVTSFLKKQFPTHLLMFRGLNVFDSTPLLKDLKRTGYDSIFVRDIFYYDPSIKLTSREGYYRRRDERVMSKKGYVISESQDYECLLQLHHNVYRDKHTHYSPLYSIAFLEEADETGFLTLKVLKQDERVVGVYGYTIRNGVMIVPFFGYDTALKNKMEIYHILIMCVMKEAQRLGVILNDGSGGEKAKINRGLKPANEYVSMYSSHLSTLRKLFFKSASYFRKTY